MSELRTTTILNFSHAFRERRVQVWSMKIGRITVATCLLLNFFSGFTGKERCAPPLNAPSVTATANQILRESQTVIEDLPIGHRARG